MCAAKDYNLNKPRADTMIFGRMRKSITEIISNEAAQSNSPEFRVICPERTDHNAVITIETLAEGKSADETGES